MATGRIPTTANSPLTAKGDLFTFSTGSAKLAVGNNGETLVADSSTSTGLNYKPLDAAGKNAIINGGFDVWQRGTTNMTSALVYTADRWQKGAATHFGISRTTVSDTTNLPFIQYAARMQRTSGSATTSVVDFGYSMESTDAVKFVGRTVTLSFYARKGANYSGAAGSSFNFAIYTGTGTDQRIMDGYTGGVATLDSSATLTTSMARYSGTVTIPTTTTEIGLYFNYTPTGTAGANDYVDITGVQLELGSTATTFSRAGGTIQGELAACQRYYYRTTTGAGNFRASGFNITTAIADVCIPLQTTMRVIPTSIDVTGTAADYAIMHQNTSTNCSAVPTLLEGAWNSVTIRMTVASGLTLGQGCQGRTNASGYVGWSAEL